MLKRLYPSGLRKQIVAWSLLPTLLILAMVAYFSFWAYGRVTEALVIDRNRELTRLLAGQMGLELSEYADRLENVADARLANDSQLELPWESYLAERQPFLHDFDSGVIVLNAEGIVVATDPRRPETLGADWSDRSYFRRIQTQSERVLLSDIERDGSEGTPVVAVAVPLFDNEELGNVIVGLFAVQPQSASAFYRSLLRLHLRAESRIYLVDSQGRAIYHYIPDWVSENISEQPAVEAVITGRVGALRGDDIASDEIIASYAPIPETTANLIEEENWNALRSISAPYGRALLAMLLIGSLIPATVVAIALGRITRPIKHLTQAANAMSRGEMSHMIEAPPDNELRELADAFNRMAAQLQELYASLEARVAARTRELSAMNDIARVVSRSLDLDEIVAAALDKLLEVMGMKAGTAYRLTVDGKSLALMARRGPLAIDLPEQSQIPLEDFVPRGALAHGAVVSDICDLPAGDLWDTLRDQGWQQMISVPLITRDELLGLINLWTRTRRDIGPEELTLLTSIGNQIGVAMENARLYREAGQLAVMAERNRLAADLHDSVTQTIFTASILAGVIPLLWEKDPEDARQQLEEVARLTRGALAEMRALLLELRPATLAQVPLDELLSRLAEATITSARLPVKIDVMISEPLPSSVRVALYRIAQEAVNNVIKHAGASQAWISATPIQTDSGLDGIELIIRDDGVGFDPAVVQEDHLGLAIMRERAESIHATFMIQSAPGEGTTIRVVWKPKFMENGFVVQDLPQRQRSPVDVER